MEANNTRDASQILQERRAYHLADASGPDASGLFPDRECGCAYTALGYVESKHCRDGIVHVTCSNVVDDGCDFLREYFPLNEKRVK